MAGLRTVRALQRLLALWLCFAPIGAPPGAAQTARAATPGVEVQPDQVVVGGMALSATTVAGWPVYYDRQIPPEAVAVATSAMELALETVPRLTGLPPSSTPLAVYLLADRARFRQALAEVGGVPVSLLSEWLGGHAIERGGTFLVFFDVALVSRPDWALADFTHEFAHLAVREASGRKAVPQWFNEGYASWIGILAQRERFPDEAEVDEMIFQAQVASALHSRGALLPWSELVTRARFAEAGRAGHLGLAYAQSALFVEWLARRHGRAALAAFLGEIGRAATVTEAFQATLGPFGPQAAEFEAEAAALPARYPRGLYRLTARPRDGLPIYLAVVGARPGEALLIDVASDGAPVRQEASDADPAGMLLFRLEAEEWAGPGSRLVTVSSASLGRLELVLQEGDVSRRFAPARGPAPAPVQLPRAMTGGPPASSTGRPRRRVRRTVGQMTAGSSSRGLVARGSSCYTGRHPRSAVGPGEVARGRWGVWTWKMTRSLWRMPTRA